MSSDAVTEARPIRPFIKYIAELLANPSSLGVIEWTAEGDGFIIVNRERFIEVWNAGRSTEIGSLAAVTRQLNTYGFRKRAGEVWWNPDFHRDHPERHVLVVPIASSSSSTKKKRKADEVSAGLSWDHAGAADAPPSASLSADGGGAHDARLLHPGVSATTSSASPASTSAVVGSVNPQQQQQQLMQKILAMQQQLAAQQRELAIRQVQVADRVQMTGQTMQKMEAVLMQRQAALEQLTQNVTAGVVTAVPAAAQAAPPSLTRSPSAMSHTSHISGVSSFSALIDAHPEIFASIPRPHRSTSFVLDPADDDATTADVLPGPNITTVD